MKTLNTQELEFALALVFQAAKRDLSPHWYNRTEVMRPTDFEACQKQITDLLKAARKAGGCLAATAVLLEHKSAFQPALFDV